MITVILTQIENNDNIFKKYTPSEGNLLHKIGTNEYYSEAYDLIDANFEYEEVNEQHEQIYEN